MNILILNWRDPGNPKSGGAEVVIWKYAHHWLKNGNKVYWMGNRFKGSSETKNYKGLEIHRVGPELPFYNTPLMLIYYPMFLINAVLSTFKLTQEYKFDLVIDAIHGLPWFSPLYLKTKIVLFVCEVAGPIWDKMYPFPINLIGKILEKIVYLIYQQCEVWAISESTKNDVLGINSKINVKVIPLGINFADFKAQTKFDHPSAIFMARLVPMKGIESVLSAVVQIVKTFPNFKLFVVGGGNPEYLAKLNQIILENKIEKNVDFMGRAPDSVRNRLYAKCHFMIHPSHKEGFGLTVLEAGASGTPTIARKGSSMDELIEDKKDGLLFEHDSQIAPLFTKYFNSPQYRQMQKNALAKSKQYDWSKILV